MIDLLDALRGEDETLWSAPRLLRADVQEAAAAVSPAEARFMVDVYYALQAFRIRSSNQAQALKANDEPNRLTTWLKERYWQLEQQIWRVLDAYSAAQPVSRWARANRGIGSVLAAGLLAHLDADPPATVGAWWRFQGYDPTVQWLGTERARALVAAGLTLGGIRGKW
jgi:hypothetical protein